MADERTHLSSAPTGRKTIQTSFFYQMQKPNLLLFQLKLISTINAVVSCWLKKEKVESPILHFSLNFHYFPCRIASHSQRTTDEFRFDG